MRILVSLILLLGLAIGTSYAMAPAPSATAATSSAALDGLLTREDGLPMSRIPGADRPSDGKTIQLAQTCRQRCRLLRSSCSSAPKVCSAHYQMCISRCP